MGSASEAVDFDLLGCVVSDVERVIELGDSSGLAIDEEGVLDFEVSCADGDHAVELVVGDEEEILIGRGGDTDGGSWIWVHWPGDFWAGPCEQGEGGSEDCDWDGLHYFHLQGNQCFTFPEIQVAKEVPIRF